MPVARPVDPGRLSSFSSSGDVGRGWWVSSRAGEPVVRVAAFEEALDDALFEQALQAPSITVPRWRSAH